MTRPKQDEQKETFKKDRLMDDHNIKMAVAEAVEAVHSLPTPTADEIKKNVIRPSTKTYSSTAVVAKTDKAVDRITQPNELAKPKSELKMTNKSAEISRAYMEKFLDSLPNGELKQSLTEQFNEAVERGFKGVEISVEKSQSNPNHDTTRAKGTQSIGGR